VYDPPGYVWAIIIAAAAGIEAATCIPLYAGAVRAGLGRGRAPCPVTSSAQERRPQP